MADASPHIPTAVEMFLRRALPHFESGKSVAESLRAVLDDDARLASAFFKRGQSQYFPTPCERGRSVGPVEQIGDVIASQLSAQVYSAFRSAAA